MAKQSETERGLAKLPACVAEFIELVIKKMRYRRKVRTDVMAELTAHFEDELRDCKSDKQREEKARQLINEFGNAKLLGVLLRRAKKRCRPLWRTIVARTFQTIGVLILCLIVYIGWFLTGKPVITVDYVAELNRIVRPVADDNLNAAPLYHKAAKAYEKLPDDISKLLRKKYEEATPEEKQLIEKCLTDNEETLELVIAGSRRPYYWQTYSNREKEYGMMGIIIPHLAEFRKLAYSLCWRVQLCAEQGRYEDAFDDIKSCYRLGQHLRGDKCLVEQLVGIAIEAWAVQALRDILGRYKLDSATLATLQKDFEQMISDEDFVISLEFEKMSMYDEIQRCFTEDRLGGGHISLEGLNRLVPMTRDPFELIFLKKAWTAPLHVLFTHPNKQQSREMADCYYAFWDKIAHKSPAQIHAEGIDIEEETMEIIEGNILLEILAPAFHNVIRSSYIIKTEGQALLSCIAILRYKNDRGNPPNSLGKLIAAGYLKELPMDPYSDKPLVYKKADDNFMLYSFGPDFDDDGGVENPKDSRRRREEGPGDQVFWPVQRN